jgi:hypothetical protein
VKEIQMVHKKLMQARVELQAMPLKKSGHNKFAGYNYFELGDFLPQVNAIFHRLGLCSVVSFDAEYASLTITDVDDGTMIVITSPMVEANMKGASPIQSLGGCQTYQRRYLYLCATDLVEGDSFDAAAPTKEQVIITPTQGAMESLPEDEQIYLKELAMDLIALCDKEEPKTAWVKLEAENLDAEQKVALWTLLPSKVRSAIKKAKE